MDYYKRSILVNIEEWLDKNKVIILYGARQVGKSTILEILSKNHPGMMILNCELASIQDLLTSTDLDRLKYYIGSSSIIALDEAQKIPGIGSVLKILHDHKEFDCKIIVTGSSSFELANGVTEPLTGRNVKFTVYPYSIKELTLIKTNAWVTDHLHQFLIYGQYPETLNLSPNEKRIFLENLSLDYLFQDILKLNNQLNTQIIKNLLRALALQLGSQVSNHELAQLIHIAPQTVSKYLELLEKCFVIYSLESLSKNLRNEIKKSKKYYFVDLGLRNALLSNFSPLELRNDVGALWENFCISERIKINSLKYTKPNLYFWRTYDQAEIDLIEEMDGNYTAFEFKWPVKTKAHIPASFLKAYPVKEQKIINPHNFFKIHDDDL